MGSRREAQSIFEARRVPVNDIAERRLSSTLLILAVSTCRVAPPSRQLFEAHGAGSVLVRTVETNITDYRSSE
jgi:hypothetical protein